ncbi:sulfotransferase [Oscillatoriales cyanobacterium LEGE 11467]|uniref:Sulfotransferase n=1 Tax=Zarconia navalis LEGE 11467 TaxID=1828826 RepID=A0A928Z7A9_9CYAN|nr:sulfotransferase [Zarconia navalis]MBE9039488.1 sulfotransferase [Zarconia navalis LEGE 11467]
MATQKIPNLFVVGSMKSGSNTLYNYLDEHPEIFMTKRPLKEPRYFVKEMNWSKGRDWYLSLFEAADKESILGEASQHYSWIPHYTGVVERIAEFSPEARILYIMRDPVARTISHYWWDVQWSNEGRDMLSAIQSMKHFTNVSNYAMQLKPYIDLFGRDRVMAITVEELTDNTVETLQQIFKWLEVDSSFVPEKLNRRDNVSPKVIQKTIGSSLFSHLRGTPLWKTIKQLVPESMREKIRDVLVRPTERDLTMLEPTRDYLRPIQQQQTEELSQLLGRQFPEWKTLYNVKA